MRYYLKSEKYGFVYKMYDLKDLKEVEVTKHGIEVNLINEGDLSGDLAIITGKICRDLEENEYEVVNEVVFLEEFNLIKEKIKNI